MYIIVMFNGKYQEKKLQLKLFLVLFCYSPRLEEKVIHTDSVNPPQTLVLFVLHH